MTTFEVLDHHHKVLGTYPEYTKLSRYHAPCGITWIPLLVGEKKVQSFADSTLREVVAVQHTVQAVDMEMVFTVEQSPAYKPAWEVNPYSLVVWKPVITLSLDLLAHVNHVSGVEIRIAA